MPGALCGQATHVRLSLRSPVQTTAGRRARQTMPSASTIFAARRARRNDSARSLPRAAQLRCCPVPRPPRSLSRFEEVEQDGELSVDLDQLTAVPGFVQSEPAIVAIRRGNAQALGLELTSALKVEQPKVRAQCGAPEQSSAKDSAR